jgi:formylglycine-generating enzyme required for sulfatase activity
MPLTAISYSAADGREDLKADGQRVARGGSWIDRPYRSTAAYRLAYEAWQPVHNVGFRVIIPAGADAKVASAR